MSSFYVVNKYYGQVGPAGEQGDKGDTGEQGTPGGLSINTASGNLIGGTTKNINYNNQSQASEQPNIPNPYYGGSIFIGKDCGSFQDIYVGRNIAIGYETGYSLQGYTSIAIGNQAGKTSQGLKSVAIGNQAGINTQNERAVAIGNDSGKISQGMTSVAIGNGCGYSQQGIASVAIGTGSGFSHQGFTSVAIGSGAGNDNQGETSVAIGSHAGNLRQGATSIAIGNQAGGSRQGATSIAIGNQAGASDQQNNTIILNATVNELNGEVGVTGAFYVKPLRNVGSNGLTSTTVCYNNSSGELFYGAKTFVIDHPEHEDRHLIHACIEGPESGVYYRGEATIPEDTNNVVVTLPSYVTKLATEITVHVTPVHQRSSMGDLSNFEFRQFSVSEVDENNTFVIVSNKNGGRFSWLVMGKRLSIDVEPLKDTTSVSGIGPYKYVVDTTNVTDPVSDPTIVDGI